MNRPIVGGPTGDNPLSLATVGYEELKMRVRCFAGAGNAATALSTVCLHRPMATSKPEWVFAARLQRGEPDC